MLTVGGLFSGIGGFELGLERAGMRVVWQCESDPFCERVLAEHWPDVLRVRDVRELGAGVVPRVDVLCGGFPCQDISVAGKGAGIGGERSGLWGEFARVIGDLRPRYVLVENVAALTSRGLDTVLGDLAARGFDAEWDCLPASAFGAPHRRDRLWLVAYPAVGSAPEWSRGWECGARWRPDAPAGGGDVADADDAGCCERRGSVAVRAQQPAAERGSQDDAVDERRPVDDAGGGRHGLPQREVRAGWDGVVGAGWWAVEPDVGRVADGVPARVDRLRALGNALVPQIAEWIGQRILEWEQLT